MLVRLTFIGAAEEATGSCFPVEAMACAFWSTAAAQGGVDLGSEISKRGLLKAASSFGPRCVCTNGLRVVRKVFQRAADGS